MKYPRIIAEISNHQWAITEQALDGILRIVSDADFKADRELFHLASEDQKAQVFESIEGREDGNDYTRIVGSAGILSIDGPIIPRSSSLRKMSGMNSISSLTREFNRLNADDSVKDIVLLMDSPGGAVTGVSEFAQLVAGSKKRTIAYVYGMAASAGYWIATAADKIVSSNTGQVGNIGVVATIAKNKNDDKIEIVSSNAKNKRPDVETEAGREQFQTIVDDLSDVFVSTVAKNRNVETKTVEKDFGQGAILIAEKALEAGMIDGISTLDNLLEEIQASDSNGFIFEMSNRGAVEINATKEVAKKEPRSKKMTIEELKRSDPDFAAEYELAMEKALNAGKLEGEKTVLDRIKIAACVLDSDYPQNMKVIAMDVINGKEDPVALKGAVIAYDGMKGAEVAAAAVADSGSAGDTPAQNVQGISGDGVVRTEEDFAACVASLTDRR